MSVTTCVTTELISICSDLDSLVSIFVETVLGVSGIFTVSTVVSTIFSGVSSVSARLFEISSGVVAETTSEIGSSLILTSS